MTSNYIFQPATAEQAQALTELRAAFGRFALTGGLDLDRTHILGSAHLAVLDLSDRLAGATVDEEAKP
ncbi:hypothetical protein FBZ89_104397 [Nitrospirillum amazonense]|uniref:Uncharacterized protein n=1 Tax=Nitrospirillum amazonense TaxID=28077 RepID=A0A560FKK5_9PROT|nr:hypothetical protein [Nitrospirillum amazonense]TWB22147.1 hypothetical protein FBZ89_104397 [Nitrospirillum amazonense]